MQVMLLELEALLTVKLGYGGKGSRLKLATETQPSGKETVKLPGPVLVKVALVLIAFTLIGAGDHITLVGVPDEPGFV